MFCFIVATKQIPTRLVKIFWFHHNTEYIELKIYYMWCVLNTFLTLLVYLSFVIGTCFLFQSSLEKFSCLSVLVSACFSIHQDIDSNCLMPSSSTSSIIWNASSAIPFEALLASFYTDIRKSESLIMYFSFLLNSDFIQLVQ